MLFQSVHTLAQQSIQPSDSPEATKILSDLEEFIRNAELINASFDVKIDMPGDEALTYKGTLVQMGTLYKLKFGTYEIKSDGDTRWVYEEEQNELNIYSAGSEDAPETPVDYLQLYRTEHFEYRMANEYAPNGSNCIEFKPTEKYTDYTKARLTFDAQTGKPLRVELFEKGGVKTDMTISLFESSEPVNPELFQFNVQEYPGVHIEDLRH